MCKANINFNLEKDGIEISFDTKPEKEILEALKEVGFRWSNKRKIWYAKNTEERTEMLKSFSFSDNVNANKELENTLKVGSTKSEYDLFDLTRTDDIENFYEKYRETNTKVIAANIRKHIRQRFPMCKWSVRSDINSIRIELISSPYEKDSDEIEAISNYVYVYVKNWNYDRSDLTTDYFNVNFYGVNDRNFTSYDYEKREMTVGEHNISEEFHNKLNDWRAAEEARKEAEYKRRSEEYAKEKERYEKRMEVLKEEAEKINQSVEVKDIENPYFVLDLINPCYSKESSVDEYLKLIEELDSVSTYIANITREVHMSREIYDMFSHHLLGDFGFLDGKGGTCTDDNRVNSMDDYSRMSEAERRTVEFYACDSVAVFCDGEFKMVIDPQGFSYARYCYFVGENTRISYEYHCKQVFDGEELAQAKSKAKEIEDISFSVITDNEWVGSWDTEHLPEYIEEMANELYNRRIFITNRIISQVEISELKNAVVKIADYMNGVQFQFKTAGIKEGQQITIMQIGCMGMFSSTHAVFKGYEEEKYAQYSDAVKVIFRPENKRSDYSNHYYKDMIVYDGYVDIPDSVHYNIEERGAFVCKSSKFPSCSNGWYDAVLEYMKNKGVKPIINTYNGYRA